MSDRCDQFLAAVRFNGVYFLFSCQSSEDMSSSSIWEDFNVVMSVLKGMSLSGEICLFFIWRPKWPPVTVVVKLGTWSWTQFSLLFECIYRLQYSWLSLLSSRFLNRCRSVLPQTWFFFVFFPLDQHHKIVTQIGDSLHNTSAAVLNSQTFLPGGCSDFPKALVYV